MVEIRDAAPRDLEQLAEVANALLATTTIEWTDEPHTAQSRAAWVDDHDVVLVAVDGDQVLGFAAYADFRDSVKWPGYRFVVEHTVHVRQDHWGTGVGRELVEALIERARAAGKRVVVAAVDGENDASIRFHERLGFVRVGDLPGIGFKLERWLDLVLLQRSLD
jgi:L-amino acid N-acyltransferase YncA